MRILAIILALWAGLSVVEAAAQGQAPGDVVSSFYREGYGLGPNSGKTGLDDALAVKFFDASLLALYRAAIKRGIDSDSFVQGQDFSITKPIEIENVSIEGNRAKVSANLTQVFEPKSSFTNHFIFVLIDTSNGWRFDDAFCEGISLTDSWKK
jgi:hypothetical protein